MLKRKDHQSVVSSYLNSLNFELLVAWILNQIRVKNKLGRWDRE